MYKDILPDVTNFEEKKEKMQATVWD